MALFRMVFHVCEMDQHAMLIKDIIGARWARSHDNSMGIVSSILTGSYHIALYGVYGLY